MFLPVALLCVFGIRQFAKRTKFINSIESVDENCMHIFDSVIFGIFIKIYLVHKMLGGIKIKVQI